MPSLISVRTTFDSASLSNLASIVHPMREPGHWRVECHGYRTMPVRIFDIVVRDGGNARAPIDVAQSADGDACCAAREKFLAPNGMLNLSAATMREGGFALLYRGSGHDPVWDSRVLQAGDHYACMPLCPGSYKISNELDGAHAIAKVNYPDPRAIARGERFKAGSVFIQIGQAMQPLHAIDPGQVLVFAIEGPTQIKVDLLAADNGPQDLASWRAARSRECLRSKFAISPGHSEADS